MSSLFSSILETVVRGTMPSVPDTELRDMSTSARMKKTIDTSRQRTHSAPPNSDHGTSLSIDRIRSSMTVTAAIGTSTQWYESMKQTCSSGMSIVSTKLITALDAVEREQTTEEEEEERCSRSLPPTQSPISEAIVRRLSNDEERRPSLLSTLQFTIGDPDVLPVEEPPIAVVAATILQQTKEEKCDKPSSFDKQSRSDETSCKNDECPSEAASTIRDDVVREPDIKDQIQSTEDRMRSTEDRIRSIETEQVKVPVVVSLCEQRGIPSVSPSRSSSVCAIYHAGCTILEVSSRTTDDSSDGVVVGESPSRLMRDKISTGLTHRKKNTDADCPDGGCSSSVSENVSCSMVLVGNSGVGKSSIVAAILNPFEPFERLKTRIRPTISVDMESVAVEFEDGERIQLHVYDTVGMERFRSIPKNMIRRVDVVALVFDASDARGVESLDEWNSFVTESGTDIIPERIVVGNKVDVLADGHDDAVRRREVDFAGISSVDAIECNWVAVEGNSSSATILAATGRNLKTRLGLNAFWDVSAKTRHNITEFVCCAAAMARKHRNEVAKRKLQDQQISVAREIWFGEEKKDKHEPFAVFDPEHRGLRIVPNPVKRSVYGATYIPNVLSHRSDDSRKDGRTVVLREKRQRPAPPPSSSCAC